MTGCGCIDTKANALTRRSSGTASLAHIASYYIVGTTSTSLCCRHTEVKARPRLSRERKKRAKKRKRETNAECMSVNVTDPTRIGRGQHLSCVHPINPVAPPPVPSSHTHQAITLAASLAPVTYVRYVLPQHHARRQVCRRMLAAGGCCPRCAG
jgi:hypothetical protein